MGEKPTALSNLPRVDDRDARAALYRCISAIDGAAAIPVAEPHHSLESDGRRFGWYMVDHHGDGRIWILCKTPPGYAEALVREDPAVFHHPASSRWKSAVGIWLDRGSVPWDRIEDVLRVAAECVARPRRRDRGPINR